MVRKKSDAAAEPQPNGTDTQTMESPGSQLPASDTNGTGDTGAEQKKRPCHQFGPYPCDGRGTSIKVAIWDRQLELENGKVITVYSCTLQKSYKDAAGEWQTTSFLRGSEIPIVVHALQMAHHWILEARNGNS